MNWEVKSLRISGYKPNECDLLNEIANKGWEPYAISGEVHYFKRVKPEGVPTASKIAKVKGKK